MKIAYSVADGSVTIVYGQRHILDRTLGRPATDAEYEADVRKDIPAEAVAIVDLPDDWSQADRSRRSEWRIVDGALVIPE